jgi:DNA-binding CsgD family transcriptional regulator
VITGAGGGPEAPLVGRDGECARIHALLDGVERSGAALLVRGEPGIGKSALLDHAAEQASARGFRVLRTLGVHAETDMPYSRLQELLRPLGEGHGRLPQVQRAALQTAFGVADRSAAQPFLVGLATLTLLTDAAAERPVLVVVDDLHWLDPLSVTVLTFVARRVEHDRIVVIGSVRSGPAYRDVVDAVLPELELTGLADADAAVLLDRAAPDLAPAVRDRIHTEAGGNPLALLELPLAHRAADPGGPGPEPALVPMTDRLERAFGDRLATLPAPAAAALLVAALTTTDELAEILAATSALIGAPCGADAVEAAVAAGLITAGTASLRFRHPLVRSAVAQSVPLPRRQQAHAALAEVLAANPYRSTWHRAMSAVGPDDAVAAQLEEAVGATPLGRGAAFEAVRALERAAQLTSDGPGRRRRFLLAAEHARELGDPAEVARLLDAAVAAAGEDLDDGDRVRVAWLHEIAGRRVLLNAAESVELTATAERSAAVGDRARALDLLHTAAARSWLSTGDEAGTAWLVECLDRIGPTSTEPTGICAYAHAAPIGRAHDVIDVIARRDPEYLDTETARLFASAAHAVGDPVRALHLSERAEYGLRAEGRLGLLPGTLAIQAQSALATGRFDRAEIAIAECLLLATETGQPLWQATAKLASALMAALRGDSEQALTLATPAEHTAEKDTLGSAALRSGVALTRGAAHLAGGRPDEAFDELARLFPAGSHRPPHARFAAVALLAEAAVRADRRDEARAALESLERVAAVAAAPALRINLLHARTVLAPDGEADAAFAHLHRVDLQGWRWNRAWLDLAEGVRLRRQRRSGESRAPLRAAVAAFDHMGAVYWADQARAELRASGEQPAGAGGRTDVHLSAQELQIARMAAEGLTNRQIGARLYLSPRTVGSHLYRIFPKLGIASRAQLPARLAAE